MSFEVHQIMEEKMNKTLSVMKEEFHGIRAGRANPLLLERIVVDYYGCPTPLKQMANISAPEPRALMIQPFDATQIKAIEKAILMSDLGLNPSNDGKVIRLMIPMLTEERRKELIKLVKRLGEDAKVALRNERREANDKLKKMNKANELTEDDLTKSEKDVQETTDKYISKTDTMVSEKEKEIMEV
jgi:ribosome recycling factor